MSNETNPFRLSMLQRSESPLEDPFESLSSSNTLASPMIRHPSSGSDASSRGSIPPQRGHNPFRVDLSEPAAPPAAFPSTQQRQPPISSSSKLRSSSPDPPSYLESEGRRHSEPSLTRPDEKPPLEDSRDGSYREGVEEGMRIARERERQRRRELRERRARQSGERGSSHSEHRSSNDRSRRSRSKSESAGHHHSHRVKPKPGTGLDVIDKMDVTGFYGGSGFHHDGPFDACAPHRNKTTKRNPATPISAFPVDGPNNSLAVEDPRLLAYRKEETVYGRNPNNDAPPELTQVSFDPKERGAKVHGQQTMGLGSSTFIDGTPASRDAIEQAGRQRSQSLGRARSLRKKADDDFNNDEPKGLLSRVRSLRVSRH